MTTIAFTCDTCEAAVEIATSDVVLALPLSLPDTCEDVGAELLCSCRHCGAAVLRSIPHRMVVLLLRSGVTTLPALDFEMVRPEYPERRPPASAALSLDDLLEFHKLLEGSHWCSELTTD